MDDGTRISVLYRALSVLRHHCGATFPLGSGSPDRPASKWSLQRPVASFMFQLKLMNPCAAPELRAPAAWPGARPSEPHPPPACVHPPHSLAEPGRQQFGLFVAPTSFLADAFDLSCGPSDVLACEPAPHQSLSHRLSFKGGQSSFRATDVHTTHFALVTIQSGKKISRDPDRPTTQIRLFPRSLGFIKTSSISRPDRLPGNRPARTCVPS